MSKQTQSLLTGLFLGLLVGYVIGREHLKYELKSVVQGAMDSFEEGIAGIRERFEGHQSEPKPDPEKSRYMREEIVLYELTAKYSHSWLRGKVAVVEGKMKNTGDRTLIRVEVTAFFVDEDGNTIYEESHQPVALLGLGDRGKPLKSGYIREFEMWVEDCPEEWDEGHVRLAVTDLEFE